jgi:hypothetical protein
MNVVEPGSPAEDIVRRAVRLLLNPRPTWDEIADEDTTIEAIYRHWVIPLAAIPAVCGAIGQIGFGTLHIFGIYYHQSLVGILGRALVGYAMTLIGIYVLALVIDELAIQFGGERGRTQAFKVAAYSGTAGWVAGVFGLLPGVGWLFQLLGGLYSLYLLYLGLPKLMRSDPDRTLTYFALALVAALGLVLLISILTSCVTSFGGPIRVY